MVEVSWPQYPKRHQSDWITGYELEVAEVSPLEGVLPFRSAAAPSSARFGLQ